MTVVKAPAAVSLSEPFMRTRTASRAGAGSKREPLRIAFQVRASWMSAASASAFRPMHMIPVVSAGTSTSSVGAIASGYASAGKYWRHPPPEMSAPSPQYNSLAVCAPSGNSSEISIVLVSHNGIPRTVNTWGTIASDCEYLVSGKLASGFADRFLSPGPRYWTYTQTHRTKLL